MINEKTTWEELYNYACLTAKEVMPGEKFLVKDLFKGFEWKRLSQPSKILLGSMFLNYVKCEAGAEFEALNKTPQNQQIYIRRK